ncbi:hypothetical protein CH354_10085 [Leptospira levettii]|nr:hypothetical protein CH354_10085 [Leptospira levettii]
MDTDRNCFLVFFLQNSQRRIRKVIDPKQRERIKSFIANQYNVNFNEWVVVGIRGGLPNDNGIIIQNSNANDEWNDTIIRIKNDTALAYQGTLDAGKKWIDAPMNPKGTFRIGEGLHYFGPGLHDNKPAFRAMSKLYGSRDSNKDGKWTASDLQVTESYPGEFGVNIHAMYRDGKVHGNSAGCIVLRHFWNSSDWNEFKTSLYKLQKFPVVILPAERIS